MSKIFFHIKRDLAASNVDYNSILNRINPSKLSNKLLESGDIKIGISAYNNAVIVNDHILALGAFNEISKVDYEFHLPIPNGVAVLFRFDSSGNLEVLTNKLASRTVWYYFDETQIIVSTSQRAIINILGNYEHNEQAVSWLISAGNLGPGTSWDRRIRHLNFDTVIYLDRENWKLDLKKVNEFRLSNEITGNNKQDFESILTNSFKQIKLAPAKCVLTLSGGYDSRFVMEMLSQNGHQFETMTWGVPNALENEDTDAYIAEHVSKRRQIKFNFFNVEWQHTNFDLFLKKFVSAGEARIDHMANYMDNFSMWDKVVDMGFDTVIRSDEVFGWLPVADEKNVRLLLEMCYLSDFANFKDISEYGMADYTIPEEYQKREDETLYSWRDRLFNIQRQTFIQAALHDLFYPYVEMIDPLFNHEIINYARRLNDGQRTNKKLYVSAIKKYVDYSPIASRPSYPSRENVLKSREAVAYFRAILADPYTLQYVSRELIDYINLNLKENTELVKKSSSRLRVWLSANMPTFFRNYVRKNLRAFNLDFNLVAFRIGMIVTWTKLIQEDLKVNHEA